MQGNQMKLFLTAFLCCLTFVLGETEPQDIQVLNDFRKGLKNPELLQWPSRGDPCGDKWPHIFCSGSRVTQIQIQSLGVEGRLPPNFNKLSMLENLGFQHNSFTGPLPSFRGLSQLQYAYLGNNKFDTIPSDFFHGLDKLQVMSLDYSPLNQTTGWSIPNSLQNSAQLMNLSLMGSNLIGPLPEFLGTMSSLTALKLSYNKIIGRIPASYRGAQLQTLWLNNQDGGKLSGPIDIVASMISLRELWLHGNGFTGTIPANIGDCTGLTVLLLNDNQLVGPIPATITSLPLESLRLDNNMLTGPIPSLKIKYSFSGNKFCQPSPGIPCAPEVTTLLDFLAGVNYPANIATAWSGNNPCTNWIGIACTGGEVSSISLPKYRLSGTLSPSVGKLNSITRIVLQGNNLHGSIPTTLSGLKSLRLLDLSGNDFGPPLPKFSSSVQVIIDGNPKLTGGPPMPSPSPRISPSSSPGNSESPSDDNSGENSGDSGSPSSAPEQKVTKTSKLVAYMAVPVACVLGGALLVGLVMFVCWKKKHNFEPASSVVIHPKDSSDPDDILKIVIANNNNVSSSRTTGSRSHSINSSGTNEARLIEVGKLVISVQVLRNVTRNFAPENELGRGGFGAVYKGEMDDGTFIAVKRMEASVISNKALDEFQAEIAVLSKVRHRHLVSLLGYSVEGNEKLLVYEYMPQGALSKHLFHWKKLNLEPLSWKRRLSIALDVARGMEYLHSLAHQSFIHRDLKSSNILLGDDYRAKVSDFGLVKLAPDGKQSVATRLAGTFGYLAPEYAVTGKVTTKVDVFSFGVVLMELVTGLTALDEGRQEEQRYLAEWFWRIKLSRDKLMEAIDPTLEVTEETFESISIIAELAGHCTVREASQRPDMGHAVNVLSPMVEKWMPTHCVQEEYMGIDCSQPLHQMVMNWQQNDGSDHSMTGLDDTKGSIPARPTGFAESFASSDGR
ncbi:receptor protein kinase TMK1-like protein [Cinnamomum micranthum f. kanehirae]|uniref:non-specific serine/threonine protein kinase n=1 Tax=Cinnamomum micranthum f. kanehirae TaxID=337451 RepID=A0A3S3NRW3_9MAGN|nr:receptor protein kinase TMK1-like protein [Cinnamomum micranthum f. kanehirae]